MSDLLVAAPNGRGSPSGLREQTLGRVRHPDPMPAEVAGPGVTLVVDPIADPIAKGDPGIGWEGDDRLALYFNVPRRRLEVWRLEADGRYRLAVHRTPRPGETVRWFDAIGGLVLQLMAHDTRRGFDVVEHVQRQNTLVDAAVTAVADERLGDANDKLAWAARRDGWLATPTGATRADMVALGDQAEREVADAVH